MQGVESSYRIANAVSHDRVEGLAADTNHYREMLSNTFGAPQGQIYSPGSMDAFHANAPYAGYEEHKRQSMEHLYDHEDGNIE